MRGFCTFAWILLAGILLASLPLAAHAGTTTTWQTYNGTTCSSVGTSFGCIPDGNSHAANGNEYQFSNCTAATASTPNCTGAGTQDLLAAAYTLKHLPSGAPDLTSTSKLSANFLGFYSGQDYGLGVENLGSPQHSVDNSLYTDFIVLELPSAATQVTINLSAFDTQENLDYTVWWGNPAGNLASLIGTTPTPLGFNNVPIDDLPTTPTGDTAVDGFYMAETSGLFDEVNCTQANVNNNVGQCAAFGTGVADQITVSAPTGFTYVIVSASLNPATAAKTPYENQANLPTNYEVDDFKINSITATNTTHPRWPRCTNLVVYTGHLTPCPEPASLAMFGVGLLGLGVTYRRRKAARAA